jgi:hypothetical protein
VCAGFLNQLFTVLPYQTAMEKTIKQILGIFGGIVLASSYLGFVVILEWLQPPQNQQIEEIEGRIEDLEKITYADFYKAQSMSGITLAENKSSYVQEGKKIGEIVDSFVREGQIADGYLLVEASVSNHDPLTKFDSVYFTLTDDYVGGHLLRNQSLPLPKTNSGGTMILFPLKEIPYLTKIPYDENLTGQKRNFLNIINSNRTIDYYSFLSSQRIGGRINKIIIKYECSVDTPNCYLKKN